jgi:hypothetical protein
MQKQFCKCGTGKKVNPGLRKSHARLPNEGRSEHNVANRAKPNDENALNGHGLCAES